MQVSTLTTGRAVRRGFFDDELTKQTKDWKQGFDFGAQNGSLGGVSEVDGFNQWPEGDMEFRTAMEDYFNHMLSLCRYCNLAFPVNSLIRKPDSKHLALDCKPA